MVNILIDTGPGRGDSPASIPAIKYSQAEATISVPEELHADHLPLTTIEESVVSRPSLVAREWVA